MFMVRVINTIGYLVAGFPKGEDLDVGNAVAQYKLSTVVLDPFTEWA